MSARAERIILWAGVYAFTVAAEFLAVWLFARAL